MVKLSIIFSIITFVISLSGCAGAPAAVKLTTQTDAPIYDNKESDKTSGNDIIASGIDVHGTATNPRTPNIANQTVRTGRYTVVKAVPTVAQTSLLDVMITVTIPNEVNSIDATIRYLLKRSGYHMSLIPSQDQKVIKILSKPLPDIHRKIGPMRLIDALAMLTTPAFELITDPVKREIRYELKNDYKTSITNIPGV
jgi:conjugative transfer region protein (TIGR03748 family)